MKQLILIGTLSAGLVFGAFAASAHDTHRHGKHHYTKGLLQTTSHGSRGHSRHHRHHARHHRIYTKRVLVKTTHTHYRPVTVRYKLVSRHVLVRPAQRIAYRTPAVTRRIAQTVMIKPARRIWTIYYDAYGRKIGCWRDKPARYATRYRTVLVRPAGVRYSVIPAQYRKVTHKVRIR